MYLLYNAYWLLKGEGAGKDSVSIRTLCERCGCLSFFFGLCSIHTYSFVSVGVILKSPKLVCERCGCLRGKGEG